MYLLKTTTESTNPLKALQGKVVVKTWIKCLLMYLNYLVLLRREMLQTAKTPTHGEFFKPICMYIDLRML